MARNPEWYADEAHSREEFLTFLRVLREDREEADEVARSLRAADVDAAPNGWDNWDIADYLRGMETFAETQSLPEQPTWELVARLLAAGKSR